MESRHVDAFNHDNLATDYDEDVADENNPIRAGYSKLLDWVILSADIDNQKEILELGSGSGNLTKRIQQCKRILCVDISTEMEVLSVPKTTHLQRREFKKSDILNLFEEDIGSFDAAVSTYTIHHLLEAEKNQLFRNIRRVLNDGGVAVFGDLMFENESAKNDIIRHYKNSEYKDVADDIEAEFFWDIENSIKKLESLGFDTKVQRFSELSFGIAAKKAEEK